MANKYFRKYNIPAATTETTIYTVPAANTAIVSSLRATNANASSGSLTVVVYPLSGVTPYYVLKDYVIPNNSTMDVFSGVPLVLEATDKLAVTASVASVSLYLSYLEVDRN